MFFISSLPYKHRRKYALDKVEGTALLLGGPDNFNCYPSKYYWRDDGGELTEREFVDRYWHEIGIADGK